MSTKFVCILHNLPGHMQRRDAEQASELVLVYRHISRTGENLVQGITESTP